MNVLDDKAKVVKRRNWKPRFSLKTLLLLPLFVGFFFLAERITKSYGTGHVRVWLEENRSGGAARYRAPFLFSQGRCSMGQNNTVESTVRYYAWLFGSVHELPWESNYVDKIDEQHSLNDIVHYRLFGKKYNPLQ
jgi:hypothetical protein